MSAAAYDEFRRLNNEEFDNGGQYIRTFRSAEDEYRSKSRAAIIIIVILIVLIIVAIILFIIWRNKKTTSSGTGTTPPPPTTTKCDSNIYCSGNTPVCNLALGVCVQCGANSDCSGSTPACKTSTNTCVECQASSDCNANNPICDTVTNKCGQCNTSSDCSVSNPICNTTSHKCIQCQTNTDCPGGTGVCNTSTNTCIQCNSNSDCPGLGVCSNQICCDPSPPSITTIIPIISSNSSITITYTFVQPTAGAVLNYVLQTPGGVQLFAGSTAATGTLTISESNLTIAIPKLFPTVGYQIKLAIQYTCASINSTTAFTTSATITMPSCSNPTPANQGVANASGIPFFLSYNGMAIRMFTLTADINVGVLTYGTAGLHPNLAQNYYSNSGTSTFSQTTCDLLGCSTSLFRFVEVPYYGPVGTSCFVTYFLITNGSCISKLATEIPFTRTF